MSKQDALILRRLAPEDIVAFPVDPTVLEAYVQDEESGKRVVLVAEFGGEVAGYVTLLWTAEDPVFRAAGIPEISDLRVLPSFRGRGVGTALLDRVEAEAGERVPRVGLNVGLHSGYGPAQRLYVRRGYLPDGSGVVVEGTAVPEGATIRLDDDPVVTLRMTKDLPRFPPGEQGSV